MFSSVRYFSNLVELNQKLSELDLYTRNLVLFAEKRIKGQIESNTTDNIKTVKIISGVSAKINKSIFYACYNR